MMGLTKRQAELLEFLRRYIAEHGRPPSVQEMAEALHLKAKSNALYILRALEERGHIRRLPNRNRAIEIVDRHTVQLSRDLGPLIESYAKQERLSVETATNELLRLALGAAA